MKKSIGIIALLLVLITTSSFIYATRTGDGEMMQNPPNNAVAQVFPNGGVHIFTGNLYPYFKSGAQIETFAVFQNQTGWMLSRKGMENGHTRTEHILLAFKPGTNILELKFPVWLTVCELGCLGCRPNQQNNGCDCPMSGDCTFGNPTLYDIQILNP